MYYQAITVPKCHIPFILIPITLNCSSVYWVNYIIVTAKVIKLILKMQRIVHIKLINRMICFTSGKKKLKFDTEICIVL